MPVFTSSDSYARFSPGPDNQTKSTGVRATTAIHRVDRLPGGCDQFRVALALAQCERFAEAGLRFGVSALIEADLAEMLQGKVEQGRKSNIIAAPLDDRLHVLARVDQTSLCLEHLPGANFCNSSRARIDFRRLALEREVDQTLRAVEFSKHDKEHRGFACDDGCLAGVGHAEDLVLAPGGVRGHGGCIYRLSSQGVRVDDVLGARRTN